MPEVRIGPHLSRRDTVPRGSDGRWPHLMTRTDSASKLYISRVWDWLLLALRRTPASCPVWTRHQTSGAGRTALHSIPDVCGAVGDGAK